MGYIDLKQHFLCWVLILRWVTSPKNCCKECIYRGLFFCIIFIIRCIIALTDLLQQPPDTQYLIKNIVPKINHKWYEFGVVLILPAHILDSLSKTASSSLYCFNKVLEYWEKQYSRSYSYTWKSLIEVLTSPLMNERPLAAEIKKRFSIIAPDEEKHYETSNLYQSTRL